MATGMSRHPCMKGFGNQTKGPGLYSVECFPQTVSDGILKVLGKKKIKIDEHSVPSTYSCYPKYL